MKIHAAQLADLDQIMAIQMLCYYAIEPESRLSMASKIIASPDTCFVVKERDMVRGYLLAIPVMSGEPPALDSEACDLAGGADCLYLHDLAVHPESRGLGVGCILVRQFMNIAHKKKFRHASLVSIQDSFRFWQKQGFEAIVPSEKLQSKLMTYGQDAIYMEKLLIDIPQE